MVYGFIIELRQITDKYCVKWDCVSCCLIKLLERPAQGAILLSTRSNPPGYFHDLWSHSAQAGTQRHHNDTHSPRWLCSSSNTILGLSRSFLQLYTLSSVITRNAQRLTRDKHLRECAICDHHIIPLWPTALWPLLLNCYISGGAGASDFRCPEEFGYYQHPTECSLYYVCVFGGPLLESCTGDRKMRPPLLSPNIIWGLLNLDVLPRLFWPITVLLSYIYANPNFWWGVLNTAD